MATRTTRVCDINEDHGEAETVSFGMDGEYFTADLCPDDRNGLAAALEEFIKVGTPISVKDLSKTASGEGSFDPAVVRAWATRKGREVKERGRVPAPAGANLICCGTGRVGAPVLCNGLDRNEAVLVAQVEA